MLTRVLQGARPRLARRKTNRDVDGTIDADAAIGVDGTISGNCGAVAA